MKKTTIVIVGYGWVGQANALALSKEGYQVAYFDPNDTPQHYTEYTDEYSKIERLSEVGERDSESTVYMVCVGDKVSDEGVQDLSIIESALKSLLDLKGVVVLRSTIIPDRLESLSFDYYVPEFLHEKTAVEECLTPFFVVIGKGNTTKAEPDFFAVWRSRTDRVFDGTPREAAFVKYVSNLWNATRIAFVNELGDAIRTPDSKEALDEINRVIDFVFERGMYLKYGRAFDGHCLPKDTRAFAHWYKDSAGGTNFFKGVLAANSAHQSLEENNPHIAEWFSAWPDAK